MCITTFQEGLEDLYVFGSFHLNQALLKTLQVILNPEHFLRGPQNRGVQWSIKMQVTSGINYSNIVHKNQGMRTDGIMGHCAKLGASVIRSGMKSNKSYRQSQKKKRKKNEKYLME